MVEIDYNSRAKNWLFRMGRASKYGPSHEEIAALCVGRIGRAKGVLFMPEVTSIIDGYENRMYDCYYAWRAEKEKPVFSTKKTLDLIMGASVLIPEIAALSWRHKGLAEKGRTTHHFEALGSWSEFNTDDSGYVNSCWVCGGHMPMSAEFNNGSEMKHLIGVAPHWASYCLDSECKKIGRIYAMPNHISVNKTTLERLSSESRKEYLLVRALKYFSDKRVREGYEQRKNRAYKCRT